MDNKQEIQQELFQEFVQPTRFKKRALKNNAAKKTHTVVFSNEQFIFGFIGLVISLIICFSLGVERGKRIGIVEKKQIKQEVIVEKIPPAPVAAIEKDHSLYFIQVASYIDIKQAEAEKEYLKKKGYNVELAKSGRHTVINIIGFINKQEAEIVALKIKDRYKDYLIRKRK